jgi:hypothetical protein
VPHTLDLSQPDQESAYRGARITMGPLDHGLYLGRLTC